MQIAVYEDAMSEISASRNIAEYNSIRSEVKERIKEIKDDYSAELRSINWNALKKNKEAMDMKDSLMAAVKRYGHLCKNKRKEFRVK
jgi:hypothetical protein